MALRGTAQNATSSSGSTISTTVTPIGIQSGDIVLIYMNAGSSVTAFTFPSGFAAVSTLTVNACNSGGTQLTMVNYKVAGGSEPSSYTVTTTGSDLMSMQVRVYSGRNTTSPFTAVAQTASTVSSGVSPWTVASTGLTAAAGDDIVVFTGYTDNTTLATDSYTYGAASGFANALTNWNSIVFGCIQGSADEVGAAAGATGTINGTLTYSPTRPDAFSGYTIAIKQATVTSPSLYYYLGSQNFY